VVRDWNNAPRSTVRRAVSPVPRVLALSAIVASVLVGACGGLSSRELADRVLREESRDDLLHAHHQGPGVVAADSGPNRYVPRLLEAFDGERAMETVRFADGYYRAPGNDGYEAVIDFVEARLREAGYGSTEGFEVGILESPLTARGPQRDQRLPAPAWTPRSARIVLHREGDPDLVLHEFAAPGDVDRVMLPINAPAADVRGPLAFSLDELGPGEVLVTDAPPRLTVLLRAQAKGAVAVLSSYLEHYNVDPSGSERHLDAVQFRTLPAGTSIPVAMISARSHEALVKTHAADPTVTVSFQAVVDFDERPLRTLWARVVGRDRPDQAVAISSHVQEPGACDNASGIAGLLESAVGLERLIRTGLLDAPSRSIVFLWGDEFRQTQAWIDQGGLEVVAGLSSDMTGENQAETGAIALLERMPDPGAVRALEPDRHTLWGETIVDEHDLTPNGLAVIARCALLDVATVEPDWVTADHPYEGGSDHDVFIAHGVPAALFWHFTDFTYHTSMDRLEFVDPNEMRRTGTALLATALAVADPRPADLDRYLRSLNAEQNVRVKAAKEAGDDDLAEAWVDWCYGARQWLREECLRIPVSETAGTSGS